MLDSLVRVSRRVLKVPKAKASPTGVHYVVNGVCPRTPSPAVERVRWSRGTSPQTPTRNNTASTCDGPDANWIRGPAPLRYRRASRPGCVNGGPNGNSPKEPLGLPPVTLGLHPTGRDVLLGEKCTRSSLRHISRARTERSVGPRGPVTVSSVQHSGADETR